MDEYAELISTFLDTGSFFLGTLAFGRHLSSNPQTILTFLAQFRGSLDMYFCSYYLGPWRNVFAI